MSLQFGLRLVFLHNPGLTEISADPDRTIAAGKNYNFFLQQSNAIVGYLVAVIPIANKKND